MCAVILSHCICAHPTNTSILLPRHGARRPAAEEDVCAEYQRDNISGPPFFNTNRLGTVKLIQFTGSSLDQCRHVIPLSRHPTSHAMEDRSSETRRRRLSPAGMALLSRECQSLDGLLPTPLCHLGILKRSSIVHSLEHRLVSDPTRPPCAISRLLPDLL